METASAPETPAPVFDPSGERRDSVHMVVAAVLAAASLVAVIGLLRMSAERPPVVLTMASLLAAWMAMMVTVFAALLRLACSGVRREHGLPSMDTESALQFVPILSLTTGLTFLLFAFAFSGWIHSGRMGICTSTFAGLAILFLVVIAYLEFASMVKEVEELE